MSNFGIWWYLMVVVRMLLEDFCVRRTVPQW
jgi:hypothetical protein